MKQTNHVYFIALFSLFICFSPVKGQTLLPRLQELFGAENVKPFEKSAFKEYYAINVPQPVDHSDTSKGIFLQRVVLGFDDASAPVVMETEGYQLNRRQTDPSYRTEPAVLLKANQIVVEHRYFGTSIPDPQSKKFLTYEQASEDYHRIRLALASIFPAKWVTTGHSKGGDAAFAYKFFYPDDVNATIAYGICLTLEKEDKRFDKFFAEKRKTADGKKIFADLIYLLKNKKRLMPLFVQFAKFSGLEADRVDVETVYDYGVLGLEFFFWQNYGNYREFEADINDGHKAIAEQGFKPDVAAKTFQDKLALFLLNTNIGFLRPTTSAHYYQAFTQGGYHGYDERPFRKYLKNKDYPLDVLAGEPVVFDNTFRTAQKKYAETAMENMIFINASTDPWSVCTIPVPPDKDNLKIVKNNANHSLQLKDFDEETQKRVLAKLNKWLQLSIN